MYEGEFVMEITNKDAVKILDAMSKKKFTCDAERDDAIILMALILSGVIKGLIDWGYSSVE